MTRYLTRDRAAIAAAVVAPLAAAAILLPFRAQLVEHERGSAAGGGGRRGGRDRKPGRWRDRCDRGGGLVRLLLHPAL